MTQVLLTSEKALPDLLTVAELARYLGVPVSTIHFWRGRDQGPPAFKVGRRLMFRSSDVAAWLNTQADSSRSSRRQRRPRQQEEVTDTARRLK